MKKCKYCREPVKKIIRNRINKGYYKTCGSKECLKKSHQISEGNNFKKVKFGENHPRWKPIFSIRPKSKNQINGYLEIKIPNQKRWQLLHRYLMEQKIGRKLLTNEIIHHINGNRVDNRIENLQILLSNEHPKIPYICPKCGCKFYQCRSKV